MRGYRIPVLTLSLLLGLSSMAPAKAGRDQDEIRRLFRAGQILSLEAIIARHRRQYSGGQLLEAQLEFERGRYVYELMILGDDGTVREFEYDARSGEFWRLEDEEHEERE